MAATAAVICAAPAWAGFRVTDPNKVLAELRSFSLGIAYDDAFTCNELVQFQGNTRDCQIHCDTYCMSQCSHPEGGGNYRFQLGVARCTKDSVSIVSDDAVSLSVPITRADYENGANTWIIPLLSQTAYFVQPGGTAEIQASFLRFVDFIENGKKSNIQVEMITGQLKFPGAVMGQSFEIWYAPGFKGPKQIVYFALGVDDILLQARGLIRGMP